MPKKPPSGWRRADKRILFTILIIIILALSAVFLVQKLFDSHAGKHTPLAPAPRIVTTCLSGDTVQAELASWEAGIAAWHTAHSNRFFAAMRMASTPWIAYKNVVQNPPAFSKEKLVALSAMNLCDAQLQQGVLAAWQTWYAAQKQALDAIAHTYNRIDG